MQTTKPNSPPSLARDIVSQITAPKHLSQSQGLLFHLALHWRQIAGEALFVHTAPLSLTQGKLILGVNDPTLMFECQLHQQTWKARINAHLPPSEGVEKLIFRLMGPLEKP